MTTRNERLLLIGGIITFLLLIPLAAMQFTNEVNWTLSDFIVAGILLFGAGLTFEGITTLVKQKKHRILFYIVLFVALLLVWAELAVGIFGSPFAGS